MPTSAQDNPGRLVFLFDAKLVLGSVTSESIKLIDELQSDIKAQKRFTLQLASLGINYMDGEDANNNGGDELRGRVQYVF